MQRNRTLPLALAAVLALGSSAALAESQYGFGTTAGVTAQARVNLSITVPNLILLRVGSAGATQDTLSWAPAITIPAGSTIPATGSNMAVVWDGTAPTIGTMTDPGGLAVYAWTNSNGGGDLNYAATAFAPAGGPALADISVTSGAGLAHPGTTLGPTGTVVTFPRNALQTGSWTYSLSPTNVGSWPAGAYTSTVTYTATSL